MFAKAYLEISNQCNLNCHFCPKTGRKPGRLSVAEFEVLAKKLRSHTDFLYFHVMGEPLMHPHLGEFLEIAHGLGFRVILTTNGTLLPKQGELLLASPGLHKVNISLHALEGNDNVMVDYLEGVGAFAKKAQAQGLLVSLRLWNLGTGKHQGNENILGYFHSLFPQEWVKNAKGYRLANRLFLEWGEEFQWPSLHAENMGEDCFCYGLRDQVAVLCDGTVVPCCLDHEGDLPLGNLFDQDMDEILGSPLATAIYTGFSNRKATQELCQKCGYARRF